MSYGLASLSALNEILDTVGTDDEYHAETYVDQLKACVTILKHMLKAHYKTEYPHLTESEEVIEKSLGKFTSLLDSVSELVCVHNCGHQGSCNESSEDCLTDTRRGPVILPPIPGSQAPVSSEPVELGDKSEDDLSGSDVEENLDEEDLDEEGHDCSDRKGIWCSTGDEPESLPSSPSPIVTVTDDAVETSKDGSPKSRESVKEEKSGKSHHSKKSGKSHHSKKSGKSEKSEKSDNVKSDNVKSDNVKSDNVKSDNVKYDTQIEEEWAKGGGDHEDFEIPDSAQVGDRLLSIVGPEYDSSASVPAEK